MIESREKAGHIVWFYLHKNLRSTTRCIVRGSVCGGQHQRCCLTQGWKWGTSLYPDTHSPSARSHPPNHSQYELYVWEKRERVTSLYDTSQYHRHPLRFLGSQHHYLNKYTHSLLNKYFWPISYVKIHSRPGPCPHSNDSVTREYSIHKDKGILKRYIYKCFITIKLLREERSDSVLRVSIGKR